MSNSYCNNLFSLCRNKKRTPSIREYPREYPREWNLLKNALENGLENALENEFDNALENNGLKNVLEYGLENTLDNKQRLLYGFCSLRSSTFLSNQKVGKTLFFVCMILCYFTDHADTIPCRLGNNIEWKLLSNLTNSENKERSKFKTCRFYFLSFDDIPAK